MDKAEIIQNSKESSKFNFNTKLKKLLKSIMFIFIIIYAVLIFAAVFLSNKLMFPAPPSSYQNLKDTKELILDDNSKITLLTKQPIGKADLTILYNHGNAVDLGKIEGKLQKIATYLNAEVISYDYPGYGTSTGSPSESSLTTAAEAVYKHIIKNLPENRKLLIWGRSIGTGPATFLAAKHPGHSLILESPFISAFRVVTHIQILPFDKFPNYKRITKINAPLLIIHGKKDKIIPFYHGKTLFNKALQPKESLWLEDAGHNDLSYEEPLKYWNTIKKFSGKL